ncbi:MAG: hypothetical protein SVW77_01170 [Candidatus Nanohaloarchaea archaeon]|nr:hypothetical protein [Candidatus Nanohaloarchaea archaeon]
MARPTAIDTWIEEEIQRRVDGPEQLAGRAERIAGDFYQEPDGEWSYDPSSPSHLLGEAHHRLASLAAKHEDGRIGSDEYDREVFLSGAVLGYEVAEACRIAYTTVPGDAAPDRETAAGYVTTAAGAVHAGIDSPTDTFEQGMHNAKAALHPEETRSDEEQQRVQELMPEDSA